ncbi:MAG: helix-turn-helix domain-containing protein [Bacteroides sp.]|nr:helix-turn-helix domain-containing protein [Eubacterium sp.]MCM1419377.1 helix-turn-helix domain-containing protein [Roseburia sp.]MCM1463199.1 helix-turn-helix domain-containing protein [Bacteroides sp.]
MAMGEKLRALRGNISQEEIASRIGITKSSWAMYERNERVPRDEVKIKIATFFNKSVQEIFFGAEH